MALILLSASMPFQRVFRMLVLPLVSQLTKTLGLICSGLLSIGLANTSARAQSVVINEVMYHPASENLRESYIELKNAGSVSVDLSGWHFIKGVQFTVPKNVVIPPGAYLVIAADPAAFTRKYPGVTNYLSGWLGTMTSHLQLADAANQLVSEVNFSNDGDWAQRILTTNGFAAYGHFGWQWYAAHDGLGSSMERINPNLSAAAAQNWGSSLTQDGTPGRPNSINSTNLAPFISGVAHAPVVPHSDLPVTVSARIWDEHPIGTRATLFYRDSSTTNPPSFTAAPMFDDGAHNDGLAGDGIYAATIPPNPAGTIIEFFLQAQDEQGQQRIYPAVIPPVGSPRTANLLYQVDDQVYNGSQPIYRLIMTEMERLELYQLGRGCPGTSPGASMDSDAEMNATWVTTDGVTSGGTTTQFRYNVGVRNRGHGTRSSNPNNYHLTIPGDRTWKAQTGINLNSQFAFSQVLGSAIFRRLEVSMAESRLVQVRVNSTNLMSVPGLPDNNSFGSYAANEQYNDDFVHRAFALDPDGNSYRAIRDQTLCDPSRNNVADLTWHGADYSVAGYTNAYFKQNHLLENDWSDLIDLIATFNGANNHALTNYVLDVQRRLDVEEWMRYMAVNTLLSNEETCLANGVGDDYALYRGSGDPRFFVLPYDLDSVIGRGRTPVAPHHSLFQMTALPAMDRFMKTPQFAAIYYRQLRDLATTVFAPGRMNLMLDQLLGSDLPQATLDNMKAFNADQVAFVLSQIPSSLTVSNGLAIQNGYPRTTAPTTALSGSANAIDTQTVLVQGAPADWSVWQGTWSAQTVHLTPGLNRILVQALDGNQNEIASTAADVWYDDGTVQPISGTIATDTIWTAGSGPYQVTSDLTVASGAALTIAPGTTVYLGAEANLIVASGGRLLAEGTVAAPIRLAGLPGSNGSWGGVVIHGSPGSPETRIAYAHLEGNGTTAIEVAGGTVYLDHLTFGTTTHQYLALDESSFLISNCYFPTSTAPFELLHGTGGIKAGGQGVVRECFFGSTSGYNDIMDFTGGNRELNQPIIQFYRNVFVGASDDMLDLDGTDAWVEGNIFLHSHKNGSPDSSSAISGGSYDYGASAGGSRTSQITVLGNLFFDCDQAATAKQGNFFALINNTIVHTTRTGGLDTASGVVNVRDLDPGPPTTFGAGFYLEGNIIVDAEQLVRNYDSSQTTVTLNRNLLPFAWEGPGTGNLVVSPMLKYIPSLAETYFTNWTDAQVMRDWFSLRSGSPGRSTGPNGRDQGGVVPLGASIAGEPTGTTGATTATLTVGLVRSGDGIPPLGWPSGAGYTHYRWRLDSGPWSAKTPTVEPIFLTGLVNGTHQVEVVGVRDSGSDQNAPELGPDAVVTESRRWTVDTSLAPSTAPTVRVNEVLALNTTSLTNGSATPDLIELYNFGTADVDLTGLGVSDSLDLPYQFTFPSGTPRLKPGEFLVLYADAQKGSPGIHLGFSLKAAGGRIDLHDQLGRGGSLLDTVSYGWQLRDLSIGRTPDGSWSLCRPTFGAPNVIQPLADSADLKINEWLTDELFMAAHDFIELFNPSLLPVAVGGLYLSNAEGAPGLSRITDLSFIAGQGYVSLIADGDIGQGSDHLNFKLHPDGGILILSDPGLNVIDALVYGPQTTDISRGRSPSGSGILASFAQPTAGGPNPVPNGGAATVTNITSRTLLLLSMTNRWRYDNSGLDRGISWTQAAFDDSAWPSGEGLFGFETTPSEYAFPFRTLVPAPNQAGGNLTVYYRAHFQWDGALSNVVLVSTNYVDDGAVYYLNGVKAGSLRMPSAVAYSTLASNQPTEGQAEIVKFTEVPLIGDNVLAVEVHQANSTSSDDVFGMELSAVQSMTNILTTTPAASVPVALNEILASNLSFADTNGLTSDWIELVNLSTNTVELAGLGLSDDANDPRKFVLPSGSILAPAGYMVLSCNGSQPASASNTGFSLNASGGSVFLFNNAVPGSLIDGVTYGLQTPDLSLGRVPNGSGPWALCVATPLADNVAAGLGNAAQLRINEWMADPASGSDWFEIYNQGRQPVSIGGFFLTGDLTKKTLSPIPPLSFIGSGANAFAQFTADSNPGAGADHVGFKLNKAGDSVGIYSPAGLLIDAVSFAAQRHGIAQGLFPDGATNVVSFPDSASPGAGNYLPMANLLINEVLSHTDAPYEDAIELFNASAAPVNLGGWFLSNTSDNLRKYRLPDSLIVPSRGYAVLYEDQFNPTNGVGTPFTLNSAHGDRVELSQSDAQGNLTGYRAVASFGPARNGISFGRFTNSIGQIDFVPMQALSFGVDHPSTVEQFRTGSGAANVAPLVGPVVISELMFHPPDLSAGEDNLQDEFIELQNITSLAVPLFDPEAPTNTWRLRGGITFQIPENITMAAGENLLIVSFDPTVDQAAVAEFRTRYQVRADVLLLGPYQGHLANSGESVLLERPDPVQLPPHPDAGFVPFVLVEKVDYQSTAPWPEGAGGTGASLQRRVASSYGNDPANWTVNFATAGRPNQRDPLDANADGLPDAWQIEHFGSADDPRAIPGADPDGDGFTNLEEFMAGTDPLDPSSFLRIDGVTIESAAMAWIRFTAIQGKPYALYFRSDLSTGSWQKLADILAQSATGTVTIADPNFGTDAARFYQLVVLPNR